MELMLIVMFNLDLFIRVFSLLGATRACFVPPTSTNVILLKKLATIAEYLSVLATAGEFRGVKGTVLPKG
jgi:hypothetical protein